ncbi:MAG: tetratricopeptide repeat protein [Prevotella sp.]|nr:tetratricopeptide repeat protein [Prevotella sp.]
MKRILFTAIAITLFFNNTFGQQNWTKKATKSVFTLKTFASDGTMLGSVNGFFIGSNGEAVSCYSPFVGAVKAVIIDSQGKEMNVESILGANETYDVIKFRVEGKRTAALPIAEETVAEGSDVWMLPYCSNPKTSMAIKGNISKTEIFQKKYTYYTININLPKDGNSISSPVLNDKGEVVGIIQQSSKANESIYYAVSAEFAKGLKTTGLSINETALKRIDIKKELPDELEQAILTMYVAGSTLDSAKYVDLINDFIVKFPNAADGYIYRAQMNANANKFSDAERDMEQALKVSDKKDDIHYNYANLIYSKELYKKDIPYENWNLDKAVTETDAAFAINPIPVYRQLKAEIRFTQKHYDEAYGIYENLINSGTNTAEIYFAAARCKEMLNDTTTMIALLDSAVNTFSKPYLKNAAPYLLARAQALTQSGKFRAAISDYNDYEQLMGNQLNANFYYIRSLIEIDGHIYQLALNDINKAIEKDPQNVLYYTTKASIEINVGLFDDAIKTAGQCIELDDKNNEGYLFLGLAQCLSGNRTEGIKNLQKAKELGDEQAQEFIEKYK